MSKENEYHLSEHYLYELFKGCVSNKRILDICSQHLKYEFLYTDIQKKVLKYIFDTYLVTNQAPTLGVIGQAYSTNKDVLSFLAKIRNTNIEGKEDNVISAFESYIKDVRFQRLYSNLADLYKGEKKEEAIVLLTKESEAIANFSIKSKLYKEVFTQYDERARVREIENIKNDGGALKDKGTWGIHEMDRITRGGPQKGRSFLGMAQSGVGKTTYLRWNALCNARLGKKVVIFQGEDTEKNAMTSFDAAWTGITTENIEHANIADDKIDAIMKTRKYIENVGGRIYVVATEQFDKMSIEDSMDVISDINRKEGPLDEALYDYLEIFSTKGQWSKGESAERRRREDVANKIVNVATIFDMITGTMTQASDVKPEWLNDPKNVLTRHHASEHKGIIKPFSYFFTLNQTQDEYDAEHLRIYFDKIRNHKSKQTIKIVQARESGRFYNAKKTLTEFDNS